MTCKFQKNNPITAYRKGCRCERCKTANRRYSAGYRSKPENKKRASEHNAKHNARPEIKKLKAEYVKYRSKKRPLIGRWKQMISRCFNESSARFKDWGGRGITVCEEFTNFTTYESYVMTLPGFDFNLAFAKCVHPKNKIQLDRIDNNGNYAPGNLRWVTPSINNNNKRKNKCDTIE